MNNNLSHFSSRENPESIFGVIFDKDVVNNLSRSNELEVEVIRSLLFFYTDQKIKLGELREFFTEKAITIFEKDGYIKIKK